MSGKYLDKIDHASLAMQYWETSIKIDRVEAVLKKLKKELKGYEKVIKKTEDRNEGQPKYWETSMKIDRAKAVLKKLKKELKCLEKIIKEIEDRNDGQPKHWYIFRKTDLN